MIIKKSASSQNSVNISNTNTGVTFRASIEIAFINIETSGAKNSEDITKINSNRIVYLMFNYDYFSKCMPMVVLYLQVPVALYKKIIDRQKKGSIKIKISGRNPLAKSDIPEVRLEHTFDYVTVNQNQPYGIKTKDFTEEDKYRGIYLGLVDGNMTSYLRTPFNGVYTNVSLKDLLSLALDGYITKNYVIEPFKYNYTYKQILIPACSTRQKFLDFLYDYDQFYDDNFLFFIDFKRVFLISRSGNGGSGINNLANKNIIVDVRPVTDSNSFKEGYTVKDKSIYVYINQMDITVNTNTSIDQMANTVVSYGERRDSKEYNITNGGRTMFVRAGSDDDDSPSIVNEIETLSTVVEFNKNNIPDDIFDLDRVITLKMYDDYEQYSGKYRLAYKRVLYKLDDDEFICATNIGLIPAGNIVTKSGSKSTDNKAVSSTARTTSSSQEGNNAVSRSQYIQDTTAEEELDFR